MKRVYLKKLITRDAGRRLKFICKKRKGRRFKHIHKKTISYLVKRLLYPSFSLVCHFPLKQVKPLRHLRLGTGKHEESSVRRNESEAIFLILR